MRAHCEPSSVLGSPRRPEEMWPSSTFLSLGSAFWLASTIPNHIYTNVTYDTTHTHYRASRVEKISLEEVKVPLLRIPGREGACP